MLWLYTVKYQEDVVTSIHFTICLKLWPQLGLQFPCVGIYV
jgi:hypothetical protein